MSQGVKVFVLMRVVCTHLCCKMVNIHQKTTFNLRICVPQQLIISFLITEDVLE